MTRPVLGGAGCGVEGLLRLTGCIGFVLQRARWQCEVILRGEQGHPWGRFGTALTVLGDVNGDKLTDVAIGAPGEQENQGAVYLFHGTSGLGISLSHSQVRPCCRSCHYHRLLLASPGLPHCHLENSLLSHLTSFVYHWASYSQQTKSVGF